MECPHCGDEIGDAEAWCPSCGAPADPDRKVLCDGCQGAFRAGALRTEGNRRLCPLCLAREDRQRLGIPSPGQARLVQQRDASRIPDLYRPRPQTSALAVASVVSILFTWPLAGLPTLALGVAALLRIRSRRDELSGVGFAVAAIVLGVLSLAAAGGLVAVGVPVYFAIREDAMHRRVATKMERIFKAEQLHFLGYERFASLEGLVESGMVEEATCRDEDYLFAVETTEEGVRVRATPKAGGATEHFLLDERGVLRHEIGEPAVAESPEWRPFRDSPDSLRAFGGF